MVDTQRFNIGPATVQVVSRVAHELARQNGRVAVLQVIPFVPFDVDTIARILESLDELPATSRIQGDDGIDYYTFSDPNPPLNIEEGEHLKDQPGLLKNLRTFSDDPEWVRRTRAQHTLLAFVASSPRPRFTCELLASRCKVPGSKVQSALNDFVSQKYVHMVEDDADEVFYVFPKIVYPPVRLEANLKQLAPADESGRVSKHWWLAAIVAALVLVIVLLELL